MREVLSSSVIDVFVGVLSWVSAPARDEVALCGHVARKSARRRLTPGLNLRIMDDLRGRYGKNE
jgi:hypothetical protein